MDARSLAMEMAPVIMWQKERKPEFYRQYWNHASRSSSKNMEPATPHGEWDMLAGEWYYPINIITFLILFNLDQTVNICFWCIIK